VFEGNEDFRSAVRRLSSVCVSPIECVSYITNFIIIEQDDRTFLANAPPEFEFELKEHLDDAKRAMTFDPNLSKIRYQLVPRLYVLSRLRPLH
jgi:hypothetical protein